LNRANERLDGRGGLVRLSDEQAALLSVVREFAQRELAPHAAERDEHATFDRAGFERLAQLGLTGLVYPPAYGGSGLGYLLYVQVIEELARADAAIATTVAVHTLAGAVIARAGNAAQRARFLSPMIEGDALGAFALSEPQAGSDAAAIQTRARRVDDTYVINGEKAFITSAGEADVYVVMTRTGPESGARGTTILLVEKDAPGMRFGPPERKMGLAASPTRSIFFEDCVVPVEQRLGEEGQGFARFMGALNTGRLSIAAQAIGGAQAAFEVAHEYAQTRVAFGQPIAQFQAIQLKLADMATSLQAARLLLWDAAAQMDYGQVAIRQASMAKLFASDMGLRVTEEAVQVLGGYGYMRDYPVERRMREAKVFQIVEGTNEIQRLLIARELLKQAPVSAQGQVRV
jgi:alkylation response protein AidB-like acyl-CoA dehydrogenase